MALKELLQDAAKDQEVVKKISQNQESVMEEYSLSDEEKEALREGDKQKINDLLGGDGGLAAAVTVISIIVVTETPMM